MLVVYCATQNQLDQSQNNKNNQKLLKTQTPRQNQDRMVHNCCILKVGCVEQQTGGMKTINLLCYLLFIFMYVFDVFGVVDVLCALCV